MLLLKNGKQLLLIDFVDNPPPQKLLSIGHFNMLAKGWSALLIQERRRLLRRPHIKNRRRNDDTLLLRSKVPVLTEEKIFPVNCFGEGFLDNGAAHALQGTVFPVDVWKQAICACALSE